MLSISKSLVLSVVSLVCEKNGLKKEENVEEVVKKLEYCLKLNEMKGMIEVSGKKLLLPFNGTMLYMNCESVVKNSGLYTQCGSKKNGETEYCKRCEKLYLSKGLTCPELGNIKDRKSGNDYVSLTGDKVMSYMSYL